MTGRVSVIMIFLNAEQYIQEAIDSVLAQTYADWELLLVDDGSTDGSTDIARQHVARDPHRIRYLEHPGHQNLGMSAARNLGLRHAQGEFIALLDSDDTWLPQKLERQVTLLRQQPAADMVYGPTLLWYGWTGRAEDEELDTPRRLGIAPGVLVEPPALLELHLRHRVTMPATCSILARRTAVLAVGGFEDEFRGLGEDKAFFSKMFLTARVYVMGETWDRYRQHADSCCFVATETGAFHPELPYPARLSFLEWFETYLAARGQQDTRVWRLLQRELWLYRHPRVNLLRYRTRALPDRIARYYWQKLVPFGFRGGRRILPRRLREWVWSRFVSHGFARGRGKLV